MSSNKVLITGAAGYIGRALISELRDHEVLALDSLALGQEPPADCAFVLGDIRDERVRAAALAGCSAVVNLAAIVGEPASNKDPQTTWGTNFYAAARLAKEARAAGVRRFVQVSTCSNYGICNEADETTALKPLSPYASSKCEAERVILELASADFRPTALRLATVYGLSPRMRFDLLVNEWTRDALLRKKLSVYGADTRRPYVHVADVARAIGIVLIHDAGGEIFNIGGENLSKATLAHTVAAEISGTEIEFTGEGTDKRDYRVIFDKARRILGFTPHRSVREGIREIRAALVRGEFADSYEQKYRNA